MNLSAIRWCLAVSMLAWALVASAFILSAHDLLWLLPALVRLVIVVAVILGAVALICKLIVWAREDDHNASDWLDVDLPERERIAHTHFEHPGPRGPVWRPPAPLADRPSRSKQADDARAVAVAPAAVRPSLIGPNQNGDGALHRPAAPTTRS